MDELLEAYEEEWGHEPTPDTIDYAILKAMSMCSGMDENYYLSFARVLIRASMEVEG